MTERDHYSDMVLGYDLSIRNRPVATFRHEILYGYFNNRIHNSP
jgi:hypothetical protein